MISESFQRPSLYKIVRSSTSSSDNTNNIQVERVDDPTSILKKQADADDDNGSALESLIVAFTNCRTFLYSDAWQECASSAVIEDTSSLTSSSTAELSFQWSDCKDTKKGKLRVCLYDTITNTTQLHLPRQHHQQYATQPQGRNRNQSERTWNFAYQRFEV